MRKSLSAAIAAVTVGASVAATALPAQAQNYYDDYNRSRSSGAAVIAGIASLAIGAALASSNRNRNSGYYNNGYQDPRYGSGYGSGYGSNYYGNSYGSGYGNSYGNGYSSGYGNSYGNGYAYSGRTCVSNEQVRDPYSGRRVVVQRRYAC